MLAVSIANIHRPVTKTAFVPVCNTFSCDNLVRIFRIYAVDSDACSVRHCRGLMPRTGIAVTIAINPVVKSALAHPLTHRLSPSAQYQFSLGKQFPLTAECGRVQSPYLMISVSSAHFHHLQSLHRTNSLIGFP